MYVRVSAHAHARQFWNKFRQDCLTTAVVLVHVALIWYACTVHMSFNANNPDKFFWVEGPMWVLGVVREVSEFEGFIGKFLL